MMTLPMNAVNELLLVVEYVYFYTLLCYEY